jgi:hypothetical protein|tara:strand:- start:986 stop:1441 length:456 start_codon:yes stop_codon:yes gene_type:complete
MKYPFKTKEENLKNYIFQLKEVCIIEHEDNWFKEKSHTKLYPNLEEAKAKVGKPHYWILNAIDKYEDEECEDIQIALIELGQLVFKTNYYSQKLTSENENEDAKKDLASSLKNLDISVEIIAEQMISMDTPKYARLEMSREDASSLIASWV